MVLFQHKKRRNTNGSHWWSKRRESNYFHNDAFFAVLFMIAVYMSFRIVFGKWSIKNRKKKVLRRLKELSKNSQKDKVLVLSSDSNGIPTLIATNTTYEFI